MPHYGLHLNADMHDAKRECVKVQANTACTDTCSCLEVYNTTSEYDCTQKNKPPENTTSSVL